jgi:hypothetical protein
LQLGRGLAGCVPLPGDEFVGEAHHRGLGLLDDENPAGASRVVNGLVPVGCGSPGPATGGDTGPLALARALADQLALKLGEHATELHHGAADVAIESAGVVLASSDPRGVTGVIRLSRASYRKMLQNLGWAAGYNVIAIPLAAGVLAWAGITLSPAIGAILMSLSTIVVALNAQTLRRVDLTPEPVPA